MSEGSEEGDAKSGTSGDSIETKAKPFGPGAVKSPTRPLSEGARRNRRRDNRNDSPYWRYGYSETQTSRQEAWSSSARVIFPKSLTIIAFHAVIGLFIYVLSAFTGASPVWLESFGLIGTVLIFSILGSVNALLLTLTTRPRNATVLLVLAGGGLMLTLMGGAVFLETLPEKFTITFKDDPDQGFVAEAFIGKASSKFTENTDNLWAIAGAKAITLSPVLGGFVFCYLIIGKISAILPRMAQARYTTDT